MNDIHCRSREILTLIVMMILISIALSSCDVTINLVHTEGSASDVVDETTKTDSKLDAKLTIPLK